MNNNFKYLAAAIFLSGALTAQSVNLNKMPTPGPTPVINIKQPKTFKMANGLTVMVVENNKLPRVSVNLSMDRPPIYEGEVAGVADILADQMGNGTQKMDKDAFNRRIDFLGADLNFSSSGATLNTLSKYFPETFKMMAEAITMPVFSPQEIQDTKERMIESEKANEKNAPAIASRVYNALTYGRNTAMGEFYTEESLNRITPKDVQDFYTKYFAPNNAYLVVVGDVKYDQVKSIVEKYLSSWKKSPVTVPAVAKAVNPKTTEIDVVDVPSAVQSTINVGNVHEIKMNDPRYFGALIANYVLGGGAESRLIMNLREKNAFTYGAYSTNSTYKYAPSFMAQSSVRNEVTDRAVAEFMNELKAAQKVTPEELTSAKAKLKGDFIRSLERPETIARFALSQKVQDLPADFYANYLRSIDNVKPADVTAATNAIIYPNGSRILVVGKTADFADKIEKLGYPVKYYDKYANPVAKPVAVKVDAGVTVASVVDKYISAVGGLDNIRKIKSLTTNASAKVQGMDMEMKRIQAEGGKSMIDVKMMGNSVQKIVFDGTNGYMQAQGQKLPLPPAAVQNMKNQKTIFEELTFANDPAYAVTGIEKYNGEDSYVVKGANTTYYYSTKTGLKTGEVKTESGMSVPITYSDYKNVAGVNLPYKITQNMGGMDVEFTVKSYEVNQATPEDFK